ncbi:MAG: diguanylate cyclase [Gammaproteobacteria bacterium]|nr:diguanylate cyclase [Gammaproteobacteria bacterium]
MGNVEHEQLQAILAELEQALYSHQEWWERISRTLICRVPHDERDVRDDAHRECRFGQWYYSRGPGWLREHAGFAAIEAEHALMHKLVAQLLTKSSEGQPVSPADYDAFANVLQRLRLEVTNLVREMQDSVVNLDPLTGATNRVGMLTRLRTQHELAVRRAQSCTIAMLDLDHFKRVNDTFGHHAGDTVLKRVVGKVRAELRPYDMVFRYGGEEFLLCLPHTDTDGALLIAERLRKSIEILRITDQDEKMISITVSVGIAALDPDCFVEESIVRADKALYEAKAAGRNRVVVWRPVTESRTGTSIKAPEARG